MRILLLLIFLSAPFAVLGQDHVSLQKKAEELYEKNDLPGALSTCKDALEAAEKKVGKKHLEYADILHDLGLYHFYSGEAEKGMQEIDDALDIVKRSAGEKSELYVNMLRDLGLIHYMSGDFSSAEKTLERAVSNAVSRSEKGYAVVLGDLAETERCLGKVDESGLHFLESKKAFEENGHKNTGEHAQLLNNYAGLYHDLGQYTRAEQLYKEAMAAFKKAGTESEADHAIALQNFGELYYEMEMYDIAKTYYDECEKLKKKVFGEKSPEYASLLNDLALWYKSTGNLSNAEVHSTRALNLKKEFLGEDDPGYINTLHNHGMLLYALGRQNEGIAIVERTVELIKPRKENYLLKYVDYCNNLASLYTYEKQYKQARPLYESILDLYEKSYGKEAGYFLLMNNLAYMYYVSGNLSKAENLYNELLQMQPADPLAQQNLALLYFDQKNYKEAEPLLRNALEYDKKYYPASSPYLLDTKLNMAVVLGGVGKAAEAKELFVQGAEGYIQLLSRSLAFMTEEERIDLTQNLYKKLGYFYSFAIDNSAQFPELASLAYNYRLATKGLLLSSISREREQLMSSRDTVLINAYTQLKAQKNFLGKLYSLSIPELEAANINLDSLQKIADNKEKQLSLKIAFLKQDDPSSATWKQVQDVMKPGEAAVEIVRLTETFQDNTQGTTYAALVLKKGSKQPEMVLLRSGKGTEGSYLNNYRNSIRGKENDSISYNIYWKKLAEHLSDVQTVYVSGDGAYNQVSIPTLKDPTSGKFVHDKWNVRVVTSTRDLLVKRPAAKKKDAVLFGYPDYKMGLDEAVKEELLVAMRGSSDSTRAGKWRLSELPGTRKEVEDISTMLSAAQWNTKVYMTSSATEQNLKAVRNPSVLHIATHGYFKENKAPINTTIKTPGIERAVGNPLLRSGLMMAGASNAWTETYDNVITWEGREDGILTAYEAMNLDLDSTDLVVLSACETGLGDVLHGEGVYGLQRSFMAAGAKYVIMSLWPVNDEATQQLMTTFYRNWISTGDIHKSFSDAQYELRKKYPHPYYWGAFVLIGR